MDQDSNVQFGHLAVLIPAYRPQPVLLQLLQQLSPAGFREILVVDDGSSPDSYSGIFQQAAHITGVKVVRNAINLGKGAALRHGMNEILCRFPGVIGVVTADADGQHTARDICRVAGELVRKPSHLILGARTIGAGSPLRSRLGNAATRRVFRLLVGSSLTDTQTGLRGIPVALMRRALHLPSRRYEFEIDVLILAKHLRISTCEVPIETIYIEGNRSSHFNPLFDSMRIWFVLLRFGFVSLLTALIDNLVFFLSFRLTGQIASSQAAARLVAMSFNYLTVRRTVFLSRDTHLRAFPRYAALVAVNGLISYALIRLFADLAGVPVMAAKITAETLLFLMNFVIQRDFIFTGSFLDAGAESDR